jgi:hypothetical protein
VVVEAGASLSAVYEAGVGEVEMLMSQSHDGGNHELGERHHEPAGGTPRDGN